MNTYERFARCVRVAVNGCWLWVGGRDGDGYGVFRDERGKSCRAHRWSYSKWIGPLSALPLDHYVCDTPSCVNPSHVRPATPRENVLRAATSLPSLNLAKTRCDRNHEFTQENTIRRPSRPDHRECRTCNRDATRARRARKKELVSC